MCLVGVSSQAVGFIVGVFGFSTVKMFFHSYLGYVTKRFCINFVFLILSSKIMLQKFILLFNKETFYSVIFVRTHYVNIHTDLPRKTDTPRFCPTFVTYFNCLCYGLKKRCQYFVWVCTTTESDAWYTNYPCIAHSNIFQCSVNLFYTRI